MAELAALFIILLAPVITIVRTSGGSASSWSSGIAAKFYGVKGQFLIYEIKLHTRRTMTFAFNTFANSPSSRRR